MDIEEITNFMIETIKDCEDIFLEGFNKTDKIIHTKSSENDLVTEYDIKINKILVEKIKEKYPQYTIISEEDDAIEQDSEYSFHIDPIDGTRNYSRGIPICYIGIGFIKYNETISCATYNPNTKEMFHAIKGKGAFENEKRINVSNRSLNLADIYYDKVQDFDVIEKAYKIIPVLKKELCAHHICAIIANGRCEGFFGKFPNTWDRCHYLLVTEAGGKVCDLNSNPYTLDRKDILITNEKCHNDLLKIVKEIKVK